MANFALRQHLSKKYAPVMTGPARSFLGDAQRPNFRNRVYDVDALRLVTKDERCHLVLWAG